jgi:uncharacterized membrane protein YeaQ/YmgE (transglycosylase-associated protein family)
MCRALLAVLLVVLMAQWAWSADAAATQPASQVKAAAQTVAGRAGDTMQKISEQGLTAEQVIAWVVAGALVGHLVGSLLTLSSGGFGMMWNLLLGGIAAFIGGFIVNVAGIDLGWPPVNFRLESLVMAVIVSVLIVLAFRKFKGTMHHMTGPSASGGGATPAKA